VLLGGLALGTLAAHQEQRLVAGIGDRVDRLGEHRGETGQQECDELRDRNAGVGQQCRDDGFLASTGRHQPSVRASSTSITGMSRRTG